jgi:hypothetical protein
MWSGVVRRAFGPNKRSYARDLWQLASRVQLPPGRLGGRGHRRVACRRRPRDTRVDRLAVIDRLVVAPDPTAAELLRERSVRVAVFRDHARRQWFIRRSSWLLYYHTVNNDKAERRRK